MHWLSAVLLSVAAYTFVGSSVSSAAVSDDIKISLNATAVVQGNNVVLKDVATISGASNDLLSRLGDVFIGPAPRVGVAEVINRYAINAAVRTQVPSASSTIDWDGAQTVRVQSAAQPVSLDAVAKEACQTLEGRLVRLYGGGKVVRVDESSAVLVPRGIASVRLRDIPADAPLTGRFTAWADVSVAGTVYRSVAMHFLLSAPVKQSGDGEKPVSLGAPGPSIHRGEVGTLHVRDAGFEIEESVVALEDGFAGQMLRVRPEHGATQLRVFMSSNGEMRLDR